MSQELPDGTRLQSSLRRARTHGALPEFSLFGVLVECVVVAVRFPTDKDNWTGMVEYDCDPLVPGFSRLTDVVKLEVINGMDDGDTNVLRVADATVSGQKWGKDESDARSRANGDRVIVAFLNGSKDRPVIIGCMPAPGSRHEMRTATLPGAPQSRRRVHRGLVTEIDGKGRVTVQAKDSTDRTHPTRASEKTISIGTNADEPVVLGTALMASLAALNSAITQLTGLLVTFSTGLNVGNLSGNAGTLSAALADVTSALVETQTEFEAQVPTNTMLSEWIKTSKEPR